MGGLICKPPSCRKIAKMTTISDFVKIPKTDSCKHLNTGMRYPTYTQWAGFMIPDFSDVAERKAGSEKDFALRADVQMYTQTRIGSAHDILLLFCNSISESLSENIILMNGTVNVDFLSKCKDSTEFLETIKKTCEKYSEKIKVRPFLGIQSDNENNLPLATMLLESGVFAGIELYGTAFAETPEKFLSIFNTAHKMNLESRISCLGLRTLKNRDEIFEIMLNLHPTRLLNPNIAINNDNLQIFKDGKIYKEVVDFIKDQNIQIEFSEAPVLSGKKEEQKMRVIREFAENDISFSLCTEDMLYLNKSITEFAVDLCNSGVFSKEEITELILK